MELAVDILSAAAEIFTETKADTLVSLNGEGEETGEFAFYRNAFWSRWGLSPERDRSGCFPFVVKRSSSFLTREALVLEAEHYQDRIGDRLMHPEQVDPGMRHLIDDDLKRVGRILSLPFGKKVLDVGCSDGTVTLMAAEKWRCEEVIGVDIARAGVEEAARQASQRGVGGRIAFVVSLIEDLDYPDNAFDTICATETLEHVNPGSFEPCLSNLARMVKPTGDLIVSVPNRYPDPMYVANKRDRWRWPAHHHFFSRLSLSYALGRFFSQIEFFPHDETHPSDEGIYLICRCRGKK